MAALVACVAADADRPRASGSEDQLAEQLTNIAERYTRTQQLPAAQLARDLRRASADLALEPSPAHWRRVLFLALHPHTSDVDRSTALDLLQSSPRPVHRASGNTLYLVPEDIIADYLTLRLGARESRETQTARAQLIDELEERLNRLSAARNRLVKEKGLLAQQLGEQQARAKTLQRQLDEITKIEKTLEDRSRSAPAERLED